MKKLIFLTLIIAFLGITQSSAQVVVRVKPARPAVIITKPVKVRAGYTWIDGHWRYNRQKARYVWVKGTWIRSKRNQRYVSGHWVSTRGGYKWVPGRWARV